jgi:hypothetical protein
MKSNAHTDDEQVLIELARRLANPKTLPLLIDQLPAPRAVELLKAWRLLTFGPPPDLASAKVARGNQVHPEPTRNR